MRLLSSDRPRRMLAGAERVEGLARWPAAPKPSTRFGGARSTSCRSTSAMASSSRGEGIDTRPASRSLSCAIDCLRAAFAGEQIAAVRGGQEILRAALDDAQAVLGEPEIGDDLRVEQADRVGRDRIAEPGMKFLGHRGAADHLAALDHFHAQPAIAR